MSAGQRETAPTDPQHPTDTTDTVVIGGGIAGLVIACELAIHGHSVTLVERTATTGGMLASAEIEGLRVDVGAEAFATRTDAVPTLIRDLDLGLEIDSPNSVGASMLVRRLGRLQHAPLPQHTIVGIPANPKAGDVRRSIGLVGSMRAAREPHIAKHADEGGLSLHGLIARRYGRRLADGPVDTICRSVYSASAKELTLAQVAPQVWQRYQHCSSLTEAVAALAQPTQAGGAVATVRGGMWRLAAGLESLARSRGVEVILGATVEVVQKHPNADWRVAIAAGDGPVSERQARHVVLASGPEHAASVISDVAPRLATAFGSLPAASVSLCAVSVTQPALDSFPVGTGVLVSEAAAGLAKALTHSNAKWAWLRDQLPEHVHVLRMSSREPEGAWMSDRVLVAAELSRVTGVHIHPADIRSLQATVWPRAATATTVRRDMGRNQATTDLSAVGLHLAGAWISGTGLASVIPQARQVSEHIHERLIGVSTPNEFTQERNT